MATKTGKTLHMAYSIGFFERMKDSDLEECFTGGPASEIREHLKELREEGFEVVPCTCGNYDSTGRCKGVQHIGAER